MTGARLKHYGWGREGEGISAEERKFVLGATERNLQLTNSTQSPSRALKTSPCENRAWCRNEGAQFIVTQGTEAGGSDKHERRAICVSAPFKKLFVRPR